MIPRRLTLPHPGEETFFLWGPRQTGKTTLLRERYPDAFWVDLLKAEEYRRYLERPELLREELRAYESPPFVVIDEVQKVPALLDEVQWLHENRRVRFALAGSSARKVRRGHANLLGGRAIRYELQGFVSMELGAQWDFGRMLNHGYLPSIYLASDPKRRLNAYVADYLKEEIAAEGLVRNLPVFSGFLNLASLSDTELVNYSTIARDCGVSSQTIKQYFTILEDTLLGKWLPAYRKRPKRRVIGAPKFYFSDVGVVNFLAKRGSLEPGSELYGKAFENWCFHELSAYNLYSESFAELSYWRLASGLEVDFVVNDLAVVIEAKSSAKITTDHLKGIRAIKEDQPEVGRAIVVCLESRPRQTEDGIDILPVETFCNMLWSGELF
ncbi:MAG TPA: AAA family ATPase [Desulfobulbaceae bacterium]|nr:MAG: AAA family ATPase [Deltaproteobacteria bacterium RIFOXYD12_FULL_53_23]HCC54591.1 AAA family ATPase [Desulfobulbaceae bacterium]